MIYPREPFLKIITIHFHFGNPALLLVHVLFLRRQGGRVMIISGQQVSKTMSDKTILIVEDNPVNRKLLMTVLRSHGLRLLTANDGEEAIRIATQELPDLILMDLQLPKMNGYTATQQLKEQSSTARIPVIALTAHAMPNERDQAKEVGFDGYITKPIDTRAFPGQVLELLSRSGSS